MLVEEGKAEWEDEGEQEARRQEEEEEIPTAMGWWGEKVQSISGFLTISKCPNQQMLSLSYFAMYNACPRFGPKISEKKNLSF